MAFHLGKPILVMTIAAIVTGATVTTRREPPRKQLTFWVFADTHYTSYKPAIEAFEKETGISVDMQIVQSHAMSRRLQADFADRLTGDGVPDLVEIGADQVGKFFRPPLDEVGFEPAQPWLQSSGYSQQIVPARFSPWSKEGKAFGVPHDVHPVGITYREDLFREAGIDLSTAKTWLEFKQLCLRFQDYWERHGYPMRHAVEFPGSRADVLSIMLLQRGINLVDDFGRVHIADPKVAETVAFYAQCVTGPDAIGGESGDGDGPLQRDMLAGNICAWLTPDWRLGKLKELGGDTLRGKLRFMPLPRFDPTDAPTACWGGTMIAILRSSSRKDEARQLIERLYFDRAGVAARHAITQILPPVKTMWDDPAYHHPDAYFGGQRIDEKLIELAGQIPPCYVTPASNIAGAYLQLVLHRANGYLKDHGKDGLEAACQNWLDVAAVDLKQRMRQWEF